MTEEKKPYTGKIISYNDQKNYIFLGMSNKETHAVITLHPKGLLLTYRDQAKGSRQGYWRRKIIPGQYSRSKVISYCISVAFAGTSKTWTLSKWLSKAFTQSGFWKKRGKLTWNYIPPNFFEVVSLHNFSRGSTRSPEMWWKQYLNHRESKLLLLFDSMSEVNRKSYLESESKLNMQAYRSAIQRDKYKSIKEKIADGKIPDKLWAIKGWDKLPISVIERSLGSEIIGTKDWSRLVNLYPNFKELWDAHPSVSPLRGMDTKKYLAPFMNMPTNKHYIDYTDELLNAGVSVLPETPLKINELKKAIEYASEWSAFWGGEYRLPAAYRPPEIALAEGWEWADHRIVHKLGGMYKNCSSSGGYTQIIVRGNGHFMYRQDRKDRGGAICFFTYAYTDFHDPLNSNPDGDRYMWEVFEIQGFANSRPRPLEPSFRAYAEQIAREIQEKFPGVHTNHEVLRRNDRRTNPFAGNEEFHKYAMMLKFSGYEYFLNCLEREESTRNRAKLQEIVLTNAENIAENHYAMAV